MATLTELRGLVRDAAGIDSADPMHTNAIITSHINATLQKIATLGDPWWLHEERVTALVADEPTYALGADVTRVRWVLLEQAKETTGLEAHRRGDMARFRDLSAGEPTAFAADGASIYVGPKPASTILPANLRVGVVIAEPKLVNDADTPKLPDHYSDILVAGAAYRASIRANNADMAAMLRGERDEGFIVLRDNMRRHLAAPRIRLTRG